MLEVLRSGRLSLGPTIDRFEELVAERVGAPYAAAVSSGTTGLHLLCVAAGIRPGDEVITSPYSFAASANCFLYEGGTPVFADIDPRTLNLDPAAVEAAITERTKAIVAVDIYGYPCELDELRALADRHGLALIGDSCEALGAEYRGAPLGSHGVSCVFAFYPEQAADDGRGRDGRDALGGRVASHPLAPQPGPAGAGRLARARPARLQLPARATSQPRSGSVRWSGSTRSSRAARRRRSATRSCSARSTGSSFRAPTTPTTAAPGSSTSSSSRTPRRASASIAAFEREGIGYNRYLPSIHLQPYMRERFGFEEGLCPVAEDVSSRSLALPFFTGIEAGRAGARRRGSRLGPVNLQSLDRVGAVHDEGRLDDPRAAPHGGAEPRGGDARARAGDGAPLPPAVPRRSTSSRRARARSRSTARRAGSVPGTRSSSRRARGTRSRTTARASS